MTGSGLRQVVPALPVREVAAAVAFYRDRLGFTAPHQDDDFAVLTRSEVIVNLWQAADEGWRSRAGFAELPVCSGAESFLAGTASCRIEAVDVDAIWAELAAAGVLHPVSREAVLETDHGAREVNALDLDGNLLTFFAFEEPAQP